MPFTPFHWGPGSWIGLLLFKILDLAAFLIGSVIIDIEPFFVIVLNLQYPIHGFFHTFLGGSIAAVLTAVILYLTRGKIKKIMAVFGLGQDSSFKKILWSVLFGVYFHIFLDSTLYAEIKPFFPFKNNPFYGLFSDGQVYLFCAFSFLIGILFYLGRSAISKKGEPHLGTK